MRLMVLSVGSVIIDHNGQTVMFGAPRHVAKSLDETGVVSPNIVMTTGFTAPGVKELPSNSLIQRSKSLDINGIEIRPIIMKHGTDYSIKADDGAILFSERGDVSAKDCAGYQFCVIKNKHRSDKMGKTVLTWPWPDAEYSVTDGTVVPLSVVMKVWNKLSEVPDNLKKMDDVSLSLEQANFIARVAESAEDGNEENFGIAIGKFKETHEIKEGKWVRKEEAKTSLKGVQIGSMYEEGISRSDDDEEDKDKKKKKKKKKNKDSEGRLDQFLEILGQIPETDGLSIQHMEHDGTRPIRRIGDMMVADLHTAYNNISDRMFKQGFISQDERMMVAGAVGEALKAFTKPLKDQPFFSREYDTTLIMPKEFKDFAPELSEYPDEVPPGWVVVHKESGDWWRWFTVTSKAIWDRHNELFSTEAMDWAIKFAKLIGDRGPLRYKHIPGVDGGHCDRQARAGEFFLESGLFDKSPLGVSMRTKMSTDPDWRISAGLLYAPSFITNGRYNRAVVIERSMTKDPAVLTTSALVQNMN